MAKADLTAERLRELLHYNPDTGIFTRIKRTRNGIDPGAVAGHRGKFYFEIGVDGQTHFSHRLAWLYMTGAFPASGIDHKDRDKLNNKWDNLREASHKQNGENVNPRKNNRSGVNGVSWHTRYRKWRARICHQRKEIHIGFFDSKEEAVAARKNAEERYFTHAGPQSSCLDAVSPSDETG